MSKVPLKVLVHLKCSVCESYLHTSPVVSHNNSQICGRCYRVLPEKEFYHRENLYEILAENFLFPCRYHLQGCPINFSFNEGEKHEMRCEFRELTSGDKRLKEKVNRNVISEKETTIQCVSSTSELEAETTFSLKGKPTLVEFSTKVSVKQNELPKDAKIILEGAVGLLTPPNCHTKIYLETGKRENLDKTPKCSHCNRLIRNQIYLCGFGHYTCRFCKGNPCPQCETHVNSTPIHPCTNFRKGCDVCLEISGIRKHILECEFNEFYCPLSCGMSVDHLSLLPEHLRIHHLNSIVLANSIVKQFSKDDEIWIMVAHDSVFKCQVLVFSDFLEFLVMVLGPEKKAENFKYDINVKRDDNNIVLVRSAPCLKWNQSVLEIGIRFLSDELKKYKVTCTKFDYTLLISKT